MTAGPVGAVVDALPAIAARQLAQLLEVAVRDASYDVDPAVRALARDLRAWSLRSAQQEAAQVFRNTPVGVPALASTAGGEEPCAHDVVDIREAARRTGRSEGLLRRHARRGRLGARRGPGGAWRLDAAAVDRFAASVRAAPLRDGRA